MKKKALIFNNIQQSFFIVSVAENDQNIKHLCVGKQYVLLLTGRKEMIKK